MDASGADKLILLVQTNQANQTNQTNQTNQVVQTNQRQTCRWVQLVKDALKKGDIWQIGVDIGVYSEHTIDLRCRFSFLVSRWRCDRFVRFLVSRFSFLVSRFSVAV